MATSDPAPEDDIERLFVNKGDPKDRVVKSLAQNDVIALMLAKERYPWIEWSHCFELKES